MSSRRRRLPSIVLAGAAIALVLISAAGLLLLRLDPARHLPPGELVDIGGYRLHMHCEGTGSPLVVLDAGMGDGALHWRLVQPAIARVTRVCSYDRAGLGWSDTGPLPRSTDRIVHELMLLLDRAAPRGPYILVGHSFGAFTVRVLAARRPDRVAGVVLVDPADPAWWESAQGREQAERNAELRRIQGWAARVGWVRVHAALAVRGLAPAPEAARNLLQRIPQETGRAQVTLWSRPTYFETVAAQWDAMPTSAAQVLDAGAPGDLPLVVVTAGSSRLPWHDTLTSLSGRSEHFTAPGSGHDVHIDQPEVVIQAIRSVLEAARR